MKLVVKDDANFYVFIMRGQIPRRKGDAGIANFYEGMKITFIYLRAFFSNEGEITSVIWEL